MSQIDNKSTGSNQKLDKKSEKIVKNFMKRQIKSIFFEGPKERALSFLEALEKGLDNLSFIDQIRNGAAQKEFELSKDQIQEVAKIMIPFLMEEFKLEELGKLLKIERKVEIGPSVSFPLPIELTRKQKIYPRLEPVEKNLIDISLWYPTTKGLSKQNLEVKTCILTKNKNFIIEYDYELSLPTVFTFEVTGILFGIWQDQGYPPTFFTSLGEICRRKGIPSSQKNRENVLKALRQLHNTRISTPFWEKDKQGNRRKIRVWKINIVNIEAENITPGKNHTIELRINKYIAGNIIQKHFALLDYKLLGQLRSRIAKRLYSLIIQYPIPYQRNLPDLKELLNLRDTHANQTIRKASEQLVNIGFLDCYNIKRSKRIKELVYKAWRSNQRTLKPQSKDTKTAIKGH